LLCCARTRLEPAHVTRLCTLLQGDVDWSYLLQTALRHRMTPLLYWHLNATCTELLPQEVLNRIECPFYVNVQRNLLLTAELVKLVNLFERHGIRTIPYKGPLLAEAVYGNLALRQSGDLDMLVSKQEVQKTQDLLTRHGYCLQPREHSLRPMHQRPADRELAFGRNDGIAVVELHWRMVAHWQIPSSFPLGFEHLWQRREQVCLAGTAIPSLAPEDLLLVLCVHGTCHHWERLSWICDIAELLRVHRQLDWARIHDQAARLDGERMLSLGLRLAAELLEAELPSQERTKVYSDPAVAWLASQVYERLFRHAPMTLAEERTFFTRTRTGMRFKLSYHLLFAQALLHTVITPNEKDRALVALPDSLSFLYYLLRPLRLVREHGLRTLRRLVAS